MWYAIGVIVLFAGIALGVAKALDKLWGGE